MSKAFSKNDIINLIKAEKLFIHQNDPRLVTCQ